MSATQTQPVRWHSVLTVEDVRAWRPDPACIAAGDEHVVLAMRCFAAAGRATPRSLGACGWPRPISSPWVSAGTTLSSSLSRGMGLLSMPLPARSLAGSRNWPSRCRAGQMIQRHSPRSRGTALQEAGR